LEEDGVTEKPDKDGYKCPPEKELSRFM